MSATWRVVVFVAMVLAIWSLMHVYVVGRLWNAPWISSSLGRRALVVLSVVLGTSYVASRFLEASGAHLAGLILESVGSTWMGVLFLLLAALLAADVVTGFGFLLPRAAPVVRTGAAALALLLSAVALGLGLRAPVIRDHEVAVPGLPAALDGTTVVAVSDLHVGTLIGTRWTERLVERVQAMDPDLICVVGDVVEGGAHRATSFVPIFRRLSAPLGVWAVTGNHEYYAGLDASVAFFRDAGFTPLRDEWREIAPGLVIAGVDDLTARRQYGEQDGFVSRTLAGRPDGATILLSHTPWEVANAARLGTGLMLSGHTHAGQIWPFRYLVAMRYPFIAGAYEVGAMTLVVNRATGTWGPRMRLWRPSEIVRVTLRSPLTSRS